jgi:plasmid stabilization system protein ParE
MRMSAPRSKGRLSKLPEESSPRRGDRGIAQAVALRIRFASGARDDLVSIRTYLMERSPRGADNVGIDIFAKIDALAEMPGMGVKTKKPGVRAAQLARYPYRILYRVDGDELVILHIRHTAQAPIDPTKLKP